MLNRIIAAYAGFLATLVLIILISVAAVIICGG